MALTLLIVFVFCGLLTMGLAVPMIQGKVKPNPYYRVRIPLTLNNPDLWYKANAYVGRVLFGSGAVTLIAAFVLYPVFSATVDGYSLGILVVILGCAVVSSVLSFRYIRSLRP